MASITTYLLPILFLTLLTGGWVAVQLLARKMRTKNHFEHGGTCGNRCTCMGIEGGKCENETEL